MAIYRQHRLNKTGEDGACSKQNGSWPNPNDLPGVDQANGHRKEEIKITSGGVPKNGKCSCITIVRHVS